MSFIIEMSRLFEEVTFFNAFCLKFHVLLNKL